MAMFSIVIKSEGPLRPSGGWHMVKNQRKKRGGIFFPQTFFLTRKKKIEPVLVPRVLKTPKINVSHDLSLTSLCLIRIYENAVFNLEICH